MLLQKEIDKKSRKVGARTIKKERKREYGHQMPIKHHRKPETLTDISGGGGGKKKRKNIKQKKQKQYLPSEYMYVGTDIRALGQMH